MGVLDVLPLLGGEHWHVHKGQEATAAFPAPFSICSTFSATEVLGTYQDPCGLELVVESACIQQSLND